MNMHRILVSAVGLCAFGLGTVSGRAQSHLPVKVFVTSSVANAGDLSADQQKEAAAVAGQLAFEIAKSMDEKYPCAQTLTQADVANLLGLERMRELLGSGDPEALNRIAGAVGADYLLAVTVTATGPGKYAFNGSMMNERSAKTEARSGTGPNSGDLMDAIDAFANQFTASLGSLSKFSKDKCNPTNVWIGTINYSREGDETTHPTQNSNASATYNETIENSHKIQVEIRIPWAGPVKARVEARTIFRSDKVNTYRVNCKVPGNWAQTKPGNGSTKSVESDESTAAGEGDSRVSAFFDGGKFVLQVNFPNVDGTFTHTANSETSGGCPGDKPKKMNVSSHGPWQSPTIHPLEVRVPANPTSAVQAGTYKDAFGGTLTWKLTRTPLKK